MVCVFLLVAIECVFIPTTHFDFVNCDDHQNVYENPHVFTGLTARDVVWAFTGAIPRVAVR